MTLASPPANRPDLLDPLEVSRLGGIEVTTAGLVEGFLSGLHRSRRRGFSVEFAEHRMYQSGDELRYVDWKLLGRNDRLYVKQFEEETNLRAMLVLDVSRSMGWTGAPDRLLPKHEYARRLAAALALVLLRQRDATGLLARLHWPVYDNHHFDGKRLNEDKNLLDWLASNGVDAQRFKQALDSHEVTIRVEEARKMLDTYKVNGVPTLVVDGKYVTSASRAGGVKEMMDVLEFLVARAREERGKK